MLNIILLKSLLVQSEEFLYFIFYNLYFIERIENYEYIQ